MPHICQYRIHETNAVRHNDKGIGQIFRLTFADKLKNGFLRCIIIKKLMPKKR